MFGFESTSFFIYFFLLLLFLCPSTPLSWYFWIILKNSTLLFLLYFAFSLGHEILHSGFSPSTFKTLLHCPLGHFFFLKFSLFNFNFLKCFCFLFLNVFSCFKILYHLFIYIFSTVHFFDFLCEFNFFTQCETVWTEQETEINIICEQK